MIVVNYDSDRAASYMNCALQWNFKVLKSMET